IPLLMWWAIESKAESDRNAVLEIFKDKNIWKNKIIQNIISTRLIRRYIIAGGNDNFATAASLIKLAPTSELSRSLVSALHEGLRGRDLVSLSPELTRVIQPYESNLFGGPLALGIRQGNKQAINSA